MSGGAREDGTHDAGAGARALTPARSLLVGAISAGLQALVLYLMLRAQFGALIGLPAEADWSLGYFAMGLTIVAAGTAARPASRAQWAILAAIVVAESLLATVGLAGGALMLVVLYPVAAGGVLLHVAAIAVSALLVLPAIWAAYCLPDRLNPWPKEDWDWRVFGIGRGGAE